MSSVHCVRPIVFNKLWTEHSRSPFRSTETSAQYSKTRKLGSKMFVVAVFDLFNEQWKRQIARVRNTSATSLPNLKTNPRNSPWCDMNNQHCQGHSFHFVIRRNTAQTNAVDIACSCTSNCVTTKKNRDTHDWRPGQNLQSAKPRNSARQGAVQNLCARREVLLSSTSLPYKGFQAKSLI